MYRRLLDFLCCPECRAPLALTVLSAQGRAADDEEIETGLLKCAAGHCYPVVRGIPRMLPGADYHEATLANFSHEWAQYELGGPTWGMTLKDRVRWFFLDPLRVPAAELRGKVLLDAGCGNGSQSVAYTAYGLEVLAIDLSTGLEHGQAYRRQRTDAEAERVHFIQGDLQRPPLRDDCVDIIHAAGVLHHTPDTAATFRALLPLLRARGTFYVWLYKHEPFVGPLVNALRTLTTRIPTALFNACARMLAPAFMLLCAALNASGLRAYARRNRREATLALMDIFGAPYAHTHTYEEVAGWYARAGFAEVWPCNDGRRGFGACGRLGDARAQAATTPAAYNQRPAGDSQPLAWSCVARADERAPLP
jgi:uncharacterized protein YbaR (Trm112 family)/ubiquinone/menaquinone biosynthesis C-methylase UbiE